MNGYFYRKQWWIISVLFILGVIYSCNYFEEPVDFNAAIKPLINKKCISCHGGVRAKGGFSLLFKEEALAPTKSGKPAIIPGDPDHSELMRRITLKDPEDRMPYKHDPLSPDEVELFRKWIRQGAPWGQHWAYIPVRDIAVPARKSPWIKNEIDPFILDKLDAQELEPAAQAPPEVLLRRVSLDLTGMPAPPELSQKYLADPSEKAYANLVDGLLNSTAFGEKWASMWLDLARYADTRGYEADRERTIWKYRDWVIDAFNQDKPYDQFLREQFAGDQLPNPSDEQYIATAFHRNTMTNDEGGTDNEEFRTAAVMDRVNTTWTGILGTTFNCVQCHSHPTDPFRHEEYYEFMAYFNNTRDEDTQSEYPLLRQYDSLDNQRLLAVKQWVSARVSKEHAAEVTTFLKTWQPAVNSLQCDRYVNAALSSSWYAALRNNGTCRLKQAPLCNKQELMYRYVTYKPGGKWRIYLDTLSGKPWKEIPLQDTKGAWDIATVSIEPLEGHHDLYFEYYHPALKNSDAYGVMFEWFRFADPFPGKGLSGYDSAYSRFSQLLRAPVQTTPILYENPDAMRRHTQVFERGNWMVKGKAVQATIPRVFGYASTADLPARVALVNWLVDLRNPLTSRVMVNRIWEQLFGTGIVETLEDFGTQGIPPTHPELLDWMAYRFMVGDHWSIKKTIRRIVRSATYRQHSGVRPELLQKDPSNKWYARGPRFRLSAEQIRDQALCVSGILSHKKYGPGVMPYQPPGVWNSPYNGSQWMQSQGEDQYRRAVYIYWKRSAAYPSTVTFDGPGRQVCVARRIRTNTPLQALTLLNDPAYLDIARQFAFRLRKETGKDAEQAVRIGYEQATGRKATAEVLQPLLKLYHKSLSKFRREPDKACEMVGVMDMHNNPETAALVVVANALLNLDEVIMKY